MTVYVKLYMAFYIGQGSDAEHIQTQWQAVNTVSEMTLQQHDLVSTLR